MTYLAVSGCAHCPARPERLGRICRVSNNLLVQIGLLSATAPLPLSGQKKSVYAPAGRNLLRMPGLAAAAQEGPRVLFAPSILHPMQQLRRERPGNAHRLAQLDETSPVSTGRTKRPIKRRFSFVPGAARLPPGAPLLPFGQFTLSFAKTKENVGKRRSAAGGGASEPLSRMRRDWRA